MAEFEGKINLNVETSEIEIEGKFKLTEDELDTVAGGDAPPPPCQPSSPTEILDSWVIVNLDDTCANWNVPNALTPLDAPFAKLPMPTTDAEAQVCAVCRHLKMISGTPYCRFNS